MDVIEIDGASNRGIDEIRELRENVRYTPAKNRYKIYIIDEVHMLTREAFNALLKTLEEPPAHIIFVLATTEPHKIPATILSRCQRYDFKRIPMREIVESLKRITEGEGVRISEQGLSAIARESEGSLRDAQSLLDQVISYGGKEVRNDDILEVLGLIDRKLLSETIEAIANRNAEKCVGIVENVYQFGYDLQHFCRELLQYLRDLILMKVSQHPEGLLELPQEEVDLLRKQSEKFQFEQLDHLFTLLLKGEEELAQSAFPRIVLEMTLIRMATLRPILPIDEILKKLERYGEVEEPAARIEADSNSIPCERPERIEREEETAPPVKERAPLSSQEARGPEVFEQKGEDGSREGREEEWRGLVDFARAKSPVLGSFLALGKLIHISGEKVEIGFEKDSFHFDRMAENENRSQLESICQEYLQRKVKVTISPFSQDANSKAQPPPGAERVIKGSEHPLVQEALRIFDGKIVGG